MLTNLEKLKLNFYERNNFTDQRLNVLQDILRPSSSLTQLELDINDYNQVTPRKVSMTELFKSPQLSTVVVHFQWHAIVAIRSLDFLNKTVIEPDVGPNLTLEEKENILAEL